VTLPTIEPVVPLNVKHSELPATIPEPLTVIVRFVEQVKFPPATAVVPAVVRKLRTVTSSSIVIVLPLAYTSSELVGLVPPFQFAAVDQFPDAAV